MLADSLPVHLTMFVLGQAAACAYLRTGLVRRGVLLLVAGWVLGDVALVARYAFPDPVTGAPLEPWYSAALSGLHLYSLIECTRLAWGRVTRRLPKAAARRDAAFRAATELYLRDRLDEAAVEFRRLARRDPWDLPARLGHATVLARRGAWRPARKALRALRPLDVDGRYRGIIDAELARCARRPAGVVEHPASGPGVGALGGQRGRRPDVVS